MLSWLFNKLIAYLVFLLLFHLTLHWFCQSQHPAKKYLSGRPISAGLICQKERHIRNFTVCFIIWLVSIMLGLSFPSAFWPPWLNIVGGTLILVALQLNYLARRHNPYGLLGEATEAMNLVKSGPYQYIRHPIYLSDIIRLAGFSLLYSSPLSVTIVVIIFYLYLNLIAVEEKELLFNLPTYQTYKTKTRNKLIPYVF